MTPHPSRPGWQAPALLVAGLAVLYAGALGSGFINDDYLFLEEARRHGLVAALAHPGGLGNYFRPLSRELWFSLLGLLTGGDALLFHVAQFALFVSALVLLADLLSVFAPARGRGVAPAVLAGVLWYAVLPFQRVNLAWVSCAQDLLALVGVLGAVALYRRGRFVPALLAYAAAALAKESALPLPAALFFWSWRIEGLAPRRAFARVLPLGVALVPWAVGEWALRAHSASAARLAFDGSALAATFAHLVQSLAGIEHAGGWLQSWADARPSVVAFALVAAVAVWLPDRATGAPAEGAPAVTPALMPARRATGFGLGWLACFALPVWPVAYGWSGYYFTLAAVGGAVLVTLAATRIARWTWIALAGALLWWHAAGVSAPAFGIAENPWTWTSHFTPFYLDRAAALSGEMRGSLQRLLPRVPTGTRFFFATLPPWAGFQMGNGPNIRQLYKDDSLESYFYSQFGDSTAGRHPCRFLYWNGVGFEELYGRARDPFFQVGTDLLLLDRPEGAAWAFQRGLESGGERLDHWYWLGWASLWGGKRALAERAWREWGAHDDTTARVLWLRKAVGALQDGDTLEARRELVEAARSGMGYPEAHAMLGLLLRHVNSKYALLETKVAAELNPADWLARRDLVAGLLGARLDDQAAGELARFKFARPAWRKDSVAVELDARLAARRPAPSGIAEFGPGGRLR
ncbi:MAG TPA: hypothetical protein VI504_13810 [Candidatus Eisenbacteria bacterium]